MNKKIVIFGILLVLWMSFIFIMSNDTGEVSGKKSSDIVVFIIGKYDKITKASSEVIKYHQSEEFMNKANHIFRKICHFTEYFILSVLFFSFIVSFNKYHLRLCSLLSIVFSVIYASLDEYHQTFIDGRGGMFSDILIDTLGAIIGCILINLIFILIKKLYIGKNII